VTEVEITAADAASTQARWAMTQYFDELATRFSIDGFDVPGAIDSASTAYAPPSGLFLLATLDGETVGCAGLQHLDDDTSEIKRMWVSPSARGQGLAKRLLARLESETLASGRTVLVLDTNATLTEAISLYEGQGYVAIERYNDNPYAQRWFRKTLESPRSA
jgi:ribosomal protein S18 acetylase RimI-like enzyme